jgi:hypothetical protein
MYVPLPLALGSGLLESLAQVAVIGASVLLLLMVVALGTYAYKHFKSDDGITWPEDMEDDPRETDDGLQQGNDEDEWKYY